MNWLDWVLLIGLGIGAVKGLMDGLINQVVALLAIGLGILFAGLLAKPIRALFDLLPAGSIDGGIASGISYALAFVVIVVGIHLLGKVVNLAINLTPAVLLNKVGGFALGICGWALMFSLILNLISSFDSQSLLIKEKTKQESHLYAPVKSVVPAVYPFIKDFLNK